MDRQTDIGAKLIQAGIVPTKQRLALAGLILRGTDWHFTTDALMAEARRLELDVSQATVYNTLKTFCDSGLIREVIVDVGRTYYDTNTSSHHHFYADDTGLLIDIPADQVVMAKLPAAPDGMAVAGYEIMIHVTGRLP
jgi:Fur family iron response transcriptional regulator